MTYEILSKQRWETQICEAESTHSFTMGYKLLCCPWKTLNTATHAFISLSPGAATPFDAELKCLSEERGNSYFIEKHTTKSPITEQFILLSELIGVSPNAILTGYAHPFRTREWNDNSAKQKEVGLQIGLDFWDAALHDGKVETVIISGSDVTRYFTSRLEASLEKEVPSGWGQTSLKTYKTQG